MGPNENDAVSGSVNTSLHKTSTMKMLRVNVAKLYKLFNNYSKNNL